MSVCMRNQHTAGLRDLKEVKGEGCLLVPHTSVNNTQEPKHKFRRLKFSTSRYQTLRSTLIHFFIVCCCVIAEHVLTEPFSITLLSMMTALVFCSQIMSQKWPHVFLRGPCRHRTCTPSNQMLGDAEGTTEIIAHNKITVKFPKVNPVF